MNISQKFLQKWTSHTLFLIPNTSYVKFSFCWGGIRGSKTFKKNYWYSKFISTRVCKKVFFSIKAKKIFFTGCPKSSVYPISPPIYMYIYMLTYYTLKFWPNFHFFGCYAWKKVWKYDLFQNFKPKSSFYIFSKNSFRIEIHTPFLPYLDNQHLRCKIFILFVGGPRGSQKSIIKFNYI